MILPLCLTFLIISASFAYATDLEREFFLETGVSSLGAYVAPRLELTPNLSLRVPLYLAQMGGVSVNQDGTAFRGDLGSVQGGVMLEYEPWDNGVYFSGGVMAGGYDLSGDLERIETESGPVDGPFGFEFMQPRDVAPVVSMGYRYLSDGGLVAGVELGGKIAAHRLRLDGLEGLSPEDRAAVEAERARINDELDDLPVIPFMAFSLGFAF
ncbi:hypothetical protein [Thioclava kandeliae]|uniref:Outer membrane protein beta-barrel domain-containing protein n=1 Tax=Thioclava kandeliae TaxID=3070818 RepID=A0ABV1SC78_9RHOB